MHLATPPRVGRQSAAIFAGSGVPPSLTTTSFNDLALPTSLLRGDFCGKLSGRRAIPWAPHACSAAYFANASHPLDSHP